MASKDSSIEGIRDGLFAKRTVVAFKDMLIGRDDVLLPLIDASLRINSAKYQEKAFLLDIEIENLTSSTFTLQNKSRFNFHDRGDIVIVPARGSTTIQVKTREKLSDLDLEFEVLNAIHAPNSHPVITMHVKSSL